MSDISNELDREVSLARIANLEVQGADRILRYAMKVISSYCRGAVSADRNEFTRELLKLCTSLQQTRPTCAALLNGIESIQRVVGALGDQRLSVDLARAVDTHAQKIAQYSLRARGTIAKHTTRLCQDAKTILTLCSSGTVISAIEELHKSIGLQGVVVLETRPRFQGWKTARLIASCGIPVTLSLDSLASKYIVSADAVFLGADAVFADGSILNKVGSYQLALLASLFEKSVYVLTTTYKAVLLAPQEFGIEQRPTSEIIPQRRLDKMRGVSVRNPAYDLVPAALIRSIICEKGGFPPCEIPRTAEW